MSGEVLEAALKTVKGNVEDKKALMAAIRGNNVDTIRGVVKFDEFGNAIGERLYPQGHAKRRPAGQFRHQDLSECQPVLDL